MSTSTPSDSDGLGSGWEVVEGPDAREGVVVTAPTTEEAERQREQRAYRCWRKWNNLMAKAISRKQWAVWGHARNYAKNGMPKNVDGPASGFGAHIGRWGWRQLGEFPWVGS